MYRSESKLLTINALQRGLDSALEAEGAYAGKLTIIEQRSNAHTSTFPSVIATCATENDSKVRLLFKFSNDLIESHGHRGGVEYETQIYRCLLSKIGLTTARFVGEYKIPDKSGTCLILEFLDNSLRVSKTGNRESMIKAARWIGEFQAMSSDRLEAPELSFIRRYDAEYFYGWARRTSEYAKQAGLNYQWIDTVCNRFDEVVDLLIGAPTAIIHGEYYSQNILFHKHAVYPVDWESAAIAVGEIDLATLTEGWPADDIEKMTAAYEHARWPGAANYDFRKILSAARVYLYFRWLGDRPEWTAESPLCFESLHASAKQMGLL